MDEYGVQLNAALSEEPPSERRGQGCRRRSLLPPAPAGARGHKGWQANLSCT